MRACGVNLNMVSEKEKWKERIRLSTPYAWYKGKNKEKKEKRYICEI